jgi:microcystin-dependent protein
MKKKYTLIYLIIVLFMGSFAHAQEPYLGEIRMFAGSFAPRGWAFCDGQLLATSSNDALFSLLGTIYGGDGRTTFGLPDLRGRLPVQAGQGSGLSSYRLGQKFGQESVVINSAQLPAHNHPVYGVSEDGTASTPAGNYPAATKLLDKEYAPSGTPVPMNFNTFGYNTTANQSINLRQPAIGIHYIIALVGVYPSRN